MADGIIHGLIFSKCYLKILLNFRWTCKSSSTNRWNISWPRKRSEGSFQNSLLPPEPLDSSDFFTGDLLYPTLGAPLWSHRPLHHINSLPYHHQILPSIIITSCLQFIFNTFVQKSIKINRSDRHFGLPFGRVRDRRVFRLFYNFIF